MPVVTGHRYMERDLPESASNSSDQRDLSENPKHAIEQTFRHPVYSESADTTL